MTEVGQLLGRGKGGGGGELGVGEQAGWEGAGSLIKYFWRRRALNASAVPRSSLLPRPARPLLR